MSGTLRRQSCTTRVAAAFVMCIAAAPVADGSRFQESARPDSALMASLAEGFVKVESGRFDDARTIFERAAAQAAAEGNVRGEAEAYRGLGRVRSSLRDFASGREAYERALALFDRAGDYEGAGRVWNHLGTDAYAQSRPAEARQCYDRALEAFRRAGLPGEEARILRNLTFLPDRSVDEKLQLIAPAVDRARLAGDRLSEGLALHTWGDLLFMRNNYAAAMEKLEAALPLLETSGGGRELARLYTSFGRLFRVHGDPARALTYYERALERQRVLRDLTGEIQSLNAIALALSVQNRGKEAAARYEDALSLARSTGSPIQIGFILQQFGSFHVGYERYARGAALLEEALTLRPSGIDRARALTSLARAYKWLGRPAAAGAAADQAVAASDESGDLEARWYAHAVRAEVELDAGHIQAALDDAREGLRLGERLRPNLLPADSFKLGFAERRQYYFNVAVSLMMQAGHVEEALAASEQGRSRAFLDLLASQDVDARPADGAELKTFVAAEAPSIDALRATAARLTSTVVSYWVTRTATFVWVLTPDGTVSGRKIPVSAARLRELVQSTWALPSESSQPITRGSGASQDRLTTGGQIAPAYRELYDVLIRPVRHRLPRGDGRLLTIVPHGPLLRLSFAALKNERGKYLLEGYRLHYTPALSVLQFTARRKRPAGTGDNDRLLLVASPSPSSAVKAGRLAPLPGAKREADAIARVSKGASLRVLSGGDARESRIRENAGVWTTIHFAVHGIVSDERPLTSYLALAGGSRDAAADDDGRLTAGEIYGLDLHADLVVLSACRTAGGRVTGDGIVGLTRAFMYAGAASVVAPVWDLIDETTPQLFEAFYAARGRGESTSAALRASQLRMLRALRAGSVVVPTAAGRFVVPEHPSIWGGLQLWGEP